MRAATQFEKRLAAVEAGEVTYAGTPCKRGHDGTRYAMTGQCVECTRARALARHNRLYQALREAKLAKEE